MQTRVDIPEIGVLAGLPFHEGRRSERIDDSLPNLLGDVTCPRAKAIGRTRSKI